MRSRKCELRRKLKAALNADELINGWVGGLGEVLLFFSNKSMDWSFFLLRGEENQIESQGMMGKTVGETKIWGMRERLNCLMVFRYEYLWRELKTKRVCKKARKCGNSENLTFNKERKYFGQRSKSVIV